MKLLIGCDMEGISGVVSWNHVDPGQPEYLRFQHVMTADVNAAVGGALAAGVDEVLVTDGHWNKTNVLVEELHPRARLNTGNYSPRGMLEGIQDSVDCVFFIGYHARNGAKNAVLGHTWSNTKVSNVWLNDRVIGEIGLNACLAGQFGAPVIMISGDAVACEEAAEWIPGVQTAVVKRGTAYCAAECLPPAAAQRIIQETAMTAIHGLKDGRAPAPLKLAGPIKITLEFFHSGMADIASWMPDVKRVDGRTVQFQGANMLEAYSQFRAAVALAA